ncbi:MAG TPA: hypothetical protein VGC61_08790, partial [Pyrinomonadaceae bacterium]
FTREKMNSLPPEEVRPTPLVTGEDLIAAGYSPGPLFKQILVAIENAQLDGKLQSKQDAMQLVRRQYPLEVKASS